MRRAWCASAGRNSRRRRRGCASGVRCGHGGSIAIRGTTRATISVDIPFLEQNAQAVEHVLLEPAIRWNHDVLRARRILLRGPSRDFGDDGDEGLIGSLCFNLDSELIVRIL